MDSQHKAIRALLNTMSPKRAESFIKAFELPADEELFLIECDVRDKSYIQVMEEYHTTRSVIRDKRRRAFSKIADAINH